MRRPEGPCKGCTPETGRSIEPSCRNTCERWAKYMKEKQEYDAMIKRGKDRESMVVEVRIFRKKGRKRRSAGDKLCEKAQR